MSGIKFLEAISGSGYDEIKHEYLRLFAKSKQDFNLSAAYEVPNEEPNLKLKNNHKHSTNNLTETKSKEEVMKVCIKVKNEVKELIVYKNDDIHLISVDPLKAISLS